MRDRAQVFIDGVPVGVVERWDPKPLRIDIPAEGAELTVLVENMGRINYGPLLRDRKGITEGVRLDNQFLYSWTVYCLPLESPEGLLFQLMPEDPVSSPEGPAFYAGTFHVDEAADTFIRLDGWTKGLVFVNGFHLGRYWERGPQKTLYLPGPLLKPGENRLVVFELHGAGEPVVLLTDTPDLGEPAGVDPDVLSFTEQ